MASQLCLCLVLLATTVASAADIVATAMNTSMNLGILSESLIAAKSIIATLQGAGPFTVFAPSDDAFNTALPKLQHTDKQQLFIRDDLADILKYHVISGNILSTALMASQTMTTLNDLPVSITKSSTQVKFATATVTLPDIVADNGVIHVINEVIIPPTFDIVATTGWNGNLSVFAEALQKANLVTFLQGTGAFTVFAPTDAAFTTALTDLGITKEQLLARSDLADILKYHVVNGQALLTSLSSPSSLTFGTLLTGHLVKLTKNGAVVNYASATVTSADIMATNGVIHLIDTMLLPPDATTSTEVPAGGVAAGSASSIQIGFVVMLFLACLTVLLSDVHGA